MAETVEAVTPVLKEVMGYEFNGKFFMDKREGLQAKMKYDLRSLCETNDVNVLIDNLVNNRNNLAVVIYEKMTEFIQELATLDPQ